ncbi:MAG: serine/threonine-protein kinase [Nocardioides sp.]
MTTTSPHRRPEVRVGPYRLLTKIGEGGMGVVHLAQAANGSRVALKVLRPHIIGDDEARDRLAREVASLRRVSSPRIAEVIDADPWGETPYVATRYVPGLSLHQHIRQDGPITGADLRWFAAGLAEAVIAVHSVGVLHRDIKPSNVLVEGRSPVLIDFGLARLAEDPRITLTGWLLGTPGYLAPEILYGDEATTASDVHAWAATMVFAATGRPPFGTGPAMAIMDRVRRGEHDLSGVPSDLLPLVREALAAEPLDRPTTGAVLAAVRGTVVEPPPSEAGEDFTLPFVLAAHDAGSGLTERHATRVLGHGGRTARVPLTRPTTPLTVPGPRLEPASSTLAAHPTIVPSRLPYMQPPSPGTRSRPALLPADVRRGVPTRVARLQRSLLLGGLLGLCMIGVAVAPYLTSLLAALAVLTVRTISWTGESARERQHLRGRRCWYDAPLTLLSAPWYLVVATGGTLMLLVWSATVTLVVGLGWAVLRLPLTPGLLVLGAVLGLTLWWGPGAKRLRLPTHRLVGRSVRDQWVGWTAVAAVALVLMALAWSASTGDVVWDPQPGPPWRVGTMLGSLVRWF